MFQLVKRVIPSSQVFKGQLPLVRARISFLKFPAPLPREKHRGRKASPRRPIRRLSISKIIFLPPVIIVPRILTVRDVSFRLYPFDRSLN